MQHDKLERSVREHALMIESFRRLERFDELGLRVVEVFHQGGRLFFIGSGALTAVANIVAGRFLHRLSLARPPLPAASLCHDVALMAALDRDGLQRQYFSRQLRALAHPGDAVIGFGESQRDEAFEEALEAAREIGCFGAALLPEKAELIVEPPDLVFRIEADNPARFAEGALFFGQLLCEFVEGELFGI